MEDFPDLDAEHLEEHEVGPGCSELELHRDPRVVGRAGGVGLPNHRRVLPGSLHGVAGGFVVR